MTTAAERARGIELWAKEGATLDEVIQALVKADGAARCWAVARATLPQKDVAVIEQATGTMLALGAFDAQAPHDGTPPAS